MLSSGSTASVNEELATWVAVAQQEGAAMAVGCRGSLVAASDEDRAVTTPPARSLGSARCFAAVAYRACAAWPSRRRRRPRSLCALPVPAGRSSAHECLGASRSADPCGGDGAGSCWGSADSHPLSACEAGASVVRPVAGPDALDEPCHAIRAARDRLCQAITANDSCGVNGAIVSLFRALPGSTVPGTNVDDHSSDDARSSVSDGSFDSLLGAYVRVFGLGNDLEDPHFGVVVGYDRYSKQYSVEVEALGEVLGLERGQFAVDGIDDAFDGFEPECAACWREEPGSVAGGYELLPTPFGPLPAAWAHPCAGCLSLEGWPSPAGCPSLEAGPSL